MIIVSCLRWCTSFFYKWKCSKFLVDIWSSDHFLSLGCPSPICSPWKLYTIILKHFLVWFDLISSMTTNRMRYEYKCLLINYMTTFELIGISFLMNLQWFPYLFPICYFMWLTQDLLIFDWMKYDKNVTKTTVPMNSKLCKDDLSFMVVKFFF